MGRFLEGDVYDLGRLLSVDGFEIFLLASGGSENWSNEKQQYDVVHSYDLGMRRILEIFQKETYLILISEPGIDRKIKFFKLDPSGCKVSDFIRGKGYKCNTIAAYGGHKGKDGKMCGYYWQTWKMVLKKRWGIFSENGYALQYRGWLDYTFFQFELNILKRGWTVIDGHDIEKFSFWDVTEDIKKTAKELIYKALEEKIRTSGKKLADALKAVGLEEKIEYLSMYERDEE